MKDLARFPWLCGYIGMLLLFIIGISFFCYEKDIAENQLKMAKTQLNHKKEIKDKMSLFQSLKGENPSLWRRFLKDDTFSFEKWAKEMLIKNTSEKATFKKNKNNSFKMTGNLLNDQLFWFFLNVLQNVPKGWVKINQATITRKHSLTDESLQQIKLGKIEDLFTFEIECTWSS